MPEEIGQLLDYDWPGNVRELAAVIERAAILGEGRRIEVAAALGGFGSVVGRAPASSPSSRPQPGPEAPILPLDRVVARHLEQTLAATGGRVEGPGGAAALLEVNPHTLRSRMRKLGIDWKRFRKV